MSWTIGVDVGGTFTDFYGLDEAGGAVWLHKRASTPVDPGRAIVEGIETFLGEHGGEGVRRLAHGTTVGTNALIQRQGGRVALLTTRGFRDLLEIGRQIRPHMYDLYADFPPPLVPRERRFELSERILADGSVHRPIDAAELAAGGRGGARVRRRGLRDLLPVRLPQPGARAGGRGCPAVSAPGAASLAVVRGAAGVPRVRALLDHRAECLSAAGDGALPGAARGRAGRAAPRGRGRHQPVERRADVARPRPRSADPHRALRSRGGRRRRGRDRRDRRPAGRRHPRHGRDQRRRRPDPGRPRGDRLRPPGRRLPDPPADGRHPHRRRRRRLDRLVRPGRAPQGRPAERRRPARPGLLRPGRRAADRDRRQPGARAPRPARPARRPDGARPRCGARRPGAARAAARLHPGAHRARPARGGRVQHGAGDPHDLGRARPRPPPLHPDAVRRRGTAARARGRRGARHPPDPGAGGARHPVRPGPGGLGPQGGLRRRPAAAGRARRRERDPEPDRRVAAAGGGLVRTRGRAAGRPQARAQPRSALRRPELRARGAVRCPGPARCRRPARALLRGPRDRLRLPQPAGSGGGRELPPDRARPALPGAAAGEAPGERGDARAGRASARSGSAGIARCRPRSTSARRSRRVSGCRVPR